MKVKSNEMGVCPICNSMDLDYGAVQFDSDMLYFPFTCKQCGCKGEEWYSMGFVGNNIKDENGNSVEITYDMIESEED